ncbi:hypothetical protein K502DRAFT_326154 [Neoconidiobolus thromboides FSU 785]|nr:hypothetical protein K502DRAFT_326154 [Neoconidiobolus thromboides FSU 785]
MSAENPIDSKIGPKGNLNQFKLNQAEGVHVTGSTTVSDNSISDVSNSIIEVKSVSEIVPGAAEETTENSAEKEYSHIQKAAIHASEAYIGTSKRIGSKIPEIVSTANWEGEVANEIVVDDIGLNNENGGELRKKEMDDSSSSSFYNYNNHSNGFNQKEIFISESRDINDINEKREDKTDHENNGRSGIEASNCSASNLKDLSDTSSMNNTIGESFAISGTDAFASMLVESMGNNRFKDQKNSSHIEDIDSNSTLGIDQNVINKNTKVVNGLSDGTKEKEKIEERLNNSSESCRSIKELEGILNHGLRDSFSLNDFDVFKNTHLQRENAKRSKNGPGVFDSTAISSKSDDIEDGVGDAELEGKVSNSTKTSKDSESLNLDCSQSLKSKSDYTLIKEDEPAKLKEKADIQEVIDKNDINQSGSSDIDLDENDKSIINKINEGNYFNKLNDFIGHEIMQNKINNQNQNCNKDIKGGDLNLSILNNMEKSAFDNYDGQNNNVNSIEQNTKAINHENDMVKITNENGYNKHETMNNQLYDDEGEVYLKLNDSDEKSNNSSPNETSQNNSLNGMHHISYTQEESGKHDNAVEITELIDDLTTNLFTFNEDAIFKSVLKVDEPSNPNNILDAIEEVFDENHDRENKFTNGKNENIDSENELLTELISDYDGANHLDNGAHHPSHVQKIEYQCNEEENHNVDTQFINNCYNDEYHFHGYVASSENDSNGFAKKSSTMTPTIANQNDYAIDPVEDVFAEESENDSVKDFYDNELNRNFIKIQMDNKDEESLWDSQQNEISPDDSSTWNRISKENKSNNKVNDKAKKIVLEESNQNQREEWRKLSKSSSKVSNNGVVSRLTTKWVDGIKEEDHNEVNFDVPGESWKTYLEWIIANKDKDIKDPSIADQTILSDVEDEWKDRPRSFSDFCVRSWSSGSQNEEYYEDDERSERKGKKELYEGNGHTNKSSYKESDNKGLKEISDEELGSNSSSKQESNPTIQSGNYSSSFLELLTEQKEFDDKKLDCFDKNSDTHAKHVDNSLNDFSNNVVNPNSISVLLEDNDNNINNNYNKGNDDGVNDNANNISSNSDNVTNGNTSNNISNDKEIEDLLNSINSVNLTHIKPSVPTMNLKRGQSETSNGSNKSTNHGSNEFIDFKTNSAIHYSNEVLNKSKRGEDNDNELLKAKRQATELCSSKSAQIFKNNNEELNKIPSILTSNRKIKSVLQFDLLRVSNNKDDSNKPSSQINGIDIGQKVETNSECESRIKIVYFDTPNGPQKFVWDLIYNPYYLLREFCTKNNINNEHYFDGLLFYLNQFQKNY